jgi:pimeloyl-ACP methyl ester carboxylesterase
VIRPEGGLVLRGRLDAGGGEDKPKVRTLLIRAEGEAAADDPVVTALTSVGRAAVTVDLRATGRGKPETPSIAGVADHNEAEWGLWIGRPLLYQWARDAVAWIDATVAADPLLTRPCELIGVGPFGLVALIAAALRPGKVARVGLIGPLVSYVGADATPWAKLPMGLIAPNLLDVADVGRLAALVAPARLVVAGGVEPSGAPASPTRRAKAFGFTRAVYRLLGVEHRLTLLDSADPSAFARSLASG